MPGQAWRTVSAGQGAGWAAAELLRTVVAGWRSLPAGFAANPTRWPSAGRPARRTRSPIVAQPAGAAANQGQPAPGPDSQPRQPTSPAWRAPAEQACCRVRSRTAALRRRQPSGPAGRDSRCDGRRAGGRTRLQGGRERRRRPYGQDDSAALNRPKLTPTTPPAAPRRFWSHTLLSAPYPAASQCLCGSPPASPWCSHPDMRQMIAPATREPCPTASRAAPQQPPI